MPNDEIMVSGRTYSGCTFAARDRGAAISTQSDLTISGCVFSGNGSQTWGTWGGAVYNGDGGNMDTTITNTSFSDNHAHHGGALSFIGSNQNITLTDVTFEREHRFVHLCRSRRRGHAPGRKHQFHLQSHQRKKHCQ